MKRYKKYIMPYWVCFVLGPVGMILGSPTMATARIYYNKLVDRFKESNKELVEKENLDK